MPMWRPSEMLKLLIWCGQLILVLIVLGIAGAVLGD